MSTKGLPKCMEEGSHQYENGVCVFCGENPLEATGWSRWRVRKCSSENCDYILSAVASTCPHCKQPQRLTLMASANRLYLLFFEPLRVFLFSQRPSGANIFEQISLILVTAIGVYIGNYIRADSKNAEYELNIINFFTALFISVLVIPSLLKEPDFLNPSTPFINRIGLALQKGVFADLVVEGLEKGLST